MPILRSYIFVLGLYNNSNFKICLSIYSTESNPGEYDFGGVYGVYFKPQMNLDELHIKGPLKEPLVLYVS